jgi:LPXTG-site transpeptidase (sortase) family protein
MRGTQQFRDKRMKQRKIKIIILTAAALIAAVCGVRLLMSPSIEREYIESVQEVLIEDLMRDIDGTNDTPEETERIADITVTEGIDFTEDNGGNEAADDEADNTDGEPETTHVLDSEPETTHAPDSEPIPTFTPVYGDPPPDNAFPNNITGIGILTIDSIDLHLPIAEGIEDAALRIAPGRVPQTAQVGETGNAVIAGHRNYAYGSMFNRIGEVATGDLIQYQARSGEMMEFTVFEIAEIEPLDQIAFIQPVNESIITLYTCTPIREATYRLIIRAQRIS